jgi:hypothetical protein
MKNLIEFESINEAAAALPAMPAFLKAAGAKSEHRTLGGPWTKDKTPNAWVLKIPAIATSASAKDAKSEEIIFFPRGTFYTIAGIPSRSFLKCEGKWKADASSNFRIGQTTIKGVAMTFNGYMVLNPPS